jgi:deazaflavin-dependent oxidoreductase (nitroreductase family)
VPTTGKIDAFYKDSSLLLLHQRGARTGKAHITPPTYRKDGERFVVLASNVGEEKHPAWFCSVLAHASVILEVGDESFPATASIPGGRRTPGAINRTWPPCRDTRATRKNWPPYSRGRVHTNKQAAS